MDSGRGQWTSLDGQHLDMSSGQAWMDSEHGQRTSLYGGHEQWIAWMDSGQWTWAVDKPGWTSKPKHSDHD